MIATFAALALAAAPTQVFFEQTTVSSVDGRAEGPGVQSRVWHAGKRMRLEAGGTPGGPAVILRLDRGVAYRLDPDRREAQRLDLDELRSRSREDASVAGELLGGAGDFRVTALRRRRQIAGFDCRGYRLRAGSTIMDVYVAPRAPATVEAFLDFLAWSGAGDAVPGLVSAIRRLPGFPLETRARVTVLGEVRETVSTVTRLSTGPVARALYEPPRGWLVVEAR